MFDIEKTFGIIAKIFAIAEKMKNGDLLNEIGDLKIELGKLKNAYADLEIENHNLKNQLAGRGGGVGFANVVRG
jgi:regulator of replication initiation timing